MNDRLAWLDIAVTPKIVAVTPPAASAGAGQAVDGHTPTVDPGAAPVASRVDLGNEGAP